MKHGVLIPLSAWFIKACLVETALAGDAEAIIEACVKHFRGNASEATIEMVIHC